ncbi:MAG TPA: hypothetical protein VFA94_00835 [Acidimicrobiales bacterium]|nr:hypothetical protein [Acidimicrobiales bacterium]
MKGVAALFAVAVLGGACTQSARLTTVAGAEVKVRADLLPTELAGLAVTPEDITKQAKEAGGHSYFTDSRLWALRSGTRLRATLQVGHLTADAFASRTPDDVLAFERQIVNQIGQAEPRLRVLGSRRVYVTSGSEQPLYIWFTGSELFILSMAKDYGEPRGLLRQALELRP